MKRTFISVWLQARLSHSAAPSISAAVPVHRARLPLFLAATLFWLTAVPGHAAMTVDSFDGPPTQNEINSFKSYILTVEPGTGGNLTPANDWVQHNSGQRVKAMGLMYEMTHDLDILDRMIDFCDADLSERNDLAPAPVGQHVIWTGRIDPVWPNTTTSPIGTGGGEGDTIGHLAYCARLILQTPSIWNNNVRIGDPKGYGATYLARAKRFVKEADYSMDHHVLSDLLDLSNRNRMYWGAGNPYMSGTVPWNQVVMFTYAFQNLAADHLILNDDPTRASRYDAIVQANMDWFFKSGEAGAAHSYADSKGNAAYTWAYRVPSGMEDWSHGSLDVMGFYRAYVSGKYGITEAMMTPLANTLMDVIRRGPGDYAGRVDGTDGSGNSGPTTYVRPGWYVSALFRPADYLTIVNDDLTAGGTTGDITRFSYFLWVKHIRSSAMLYQGCNYGGWSAAFEPGSYTLADMRTFGAVNDDASSIRIPSGYSVTLYQNDNFSGNSVTLTGDNSCMTGIGFNDAVSSLKVSASSCAPTAVIPYVQVNGGSWQQTSGVTVNSGSTLKFGPQPTSGGAWNWSGCGTGGTSREQTVSPSSSCTATASYVNACGASSRQNFTVTVSSSSPTPAPTPTPTPAPTPTGTCSGVPQYVDGQAYNTGAVVQNVGNKYQCSIGGWCSQGGPYAPGTGWAWTYAWSQTGTCQ